jgi:hypothetical protein
MSEVLVCTRCGFANPLGQHFCTRCAERLTPRMQSVTTPVSPAHSPASWSPNTPLSYEARKGVDRTFTGVLLIIIGFLLTPLPYANYFGSLLLIIGAILVILGREFFGAKHSRLVMRSLGIYIVGLAVVILNVAVFTDSLASAISVGLSPTALGQLVVQAANQFLVGLIISGAVTGVAILFFTYALQNSTGRLLLWAGYAATIAVGVAVFYIVSSDVATEVQQATSASPPDLAPIAALQGQIQLIGLINYIPAVLNAIAYSLVLLRIRDGELPATPSGR